MADVQNQSTHAGHTINFKIGGIVVGRGQSISGRRSFGTEGQYELSSIMPQEHTPLRFEGSVTFEKYHVRKASLKKVGLSAYGVGILKKGVIDIEITDKYTGEIIVVYRNCTLSEQSEDFRANAYAGEQATWLYLSSDDGTPETAV